MSRIAVVFVSYLKVPESRLQDHFTWNDEIYCFYGDDLRVYVVSDVEHDLPDYAETVIFPMERLPVVDEQPRFSLSMTKNAGIQKAISDGAASILCTDVDISFGWFTSAPSRFEFWDGTAVIPRYRMAPSFEIRTEGRLDLGCTGTIGMTAKDWQRVQFNEECFCYGKEDGILLQDIVRAGIGVNRRGIVSHIAHVPGDGDRIPGKGSATCWGREDGFNFENFDHNSRVSSRRGRRIRMSRKGKR